MDVRWTSHLKDQKSKEDFEILVRNSTMVLGRLYDIIKQEESAMVAEESSISDYDTPSWGYKQAHRNGDRSRVKKLLDLLSFLERK